MIAEYDDLHSSSGNPEGLHLAKHGKTLRLPHPAKSATEVARMPQCSVSDSE